MLSKQFQCPDCGSLSGFRSHPRTFTEKYILPVMFLRPVRCADCYRRDYHTVFMDVREREESEVSRKAAA